MRSCMAPHGPDREAWDKATHEDTSKPVKYPGDSMAFMFESTYLLKLSDFGAKGKLRWRCTLSTARVVDSEVQRRPTWTTSIAGVAFPTCSASAARRNEARSDVQTFAS